MSGEIRPLPDDPSAAVVRSMMDLGSEEWLLLTSGDFHSAAVETMQRDGTGHQIAVALELPCRVNRSDERRTVRLLFDPEAAMDIALALAETGQWLVARQRMGN